jgi:hypothetical protein
MLWSQSISKQWNVIYKSMGFHLPMTKANENTHDPALNRAPFSRWMLRDKAAQRRLALRLGVMNETSNVGVMPLQQEVQPESAT